jgi:hypothetical protein
MDADAGAGPEPARPLGFLEVDDPAIGEQIDSLAEGLDALDLRRDT